MTFRIRAKHYKSLRHLDWAPEGVCALVGPNGSGKSTVLWTPEVLRLALSSDLVHALKYVGGSGVVRHFAAPDTEPTELTIEVGRLAWTLRPEMNTQVWERLREGEVTLMERFPGENSIRVGSNSFLAKDLMGLERAANADDALVERIAPLVNLIRGYRVYGDYELRVLRETGSPQTSEARMSASGTNVFSVLQLWRTQSDHEHRWSFVVDRLKEAFPQFFQTFDFEPAGNVISLVVRTPGRHALRPNDWPNGFFATLLNLCAVAGSDDGGVVALDEPETALHPALLRFCVQAFRDWAVEHGTTVLLATHSPVLLDEFEAQPELIFVMDQTREVLPVSLDVLKKREWLKHFSLGELYEHSAFGAPGEGAS